MLMEISTHQKPRFLECLGGMPVAVAAGLTYPKWRELSHIVAPLPTDRIVLVDTRNLDPG